MNACKRQKTGEEPALPPVPDDALYEAIMSSDWEKTRELLRRPDAHVLVRYDNDEGHSQMYCACDWNPPLDIIEALYRLTPEATTDIYDEGWTTLHNACHCSSEFVVGFLLEKAPHMVLVRDDENFLPIHNAVSKSRSPSLIRRLLLVHPMSIYDSVLEQFYNKWNHMFEIEKPEFPRTHVDLSLCKATFSLLLKAYLRGTVVDTDEEWEPVNEVLSNNLLPPVHRKMLTTLLSNSARADSGGDFPLHLVCAQLKPLDNSILSLE